MTSPAEFEPATCGLEIRWCYQLNQYEVQNRGKESVRKPTPRSSALELWKTMRVLPREGTHSVEVDIMRRPIAALVLTAGLAMAAVAAPSEAQAQGRDWGWGVVAGYVAGASIANSTWGYPGYSGYGYPAYGYAYPRYGLGYGYGYGPAYGVSYAYPANYGAYYRPYYGYAFAGPPAGRRVVIHRARWR